MKKDLSKCCKAPVKVEGVPDFGDGSKDDISTCYNSCTVCKKACDVYPLVTVKPLYFEPNKLEFCSECAMVLVDGYPHQHIPLYAGWEPLKKHFREIQKELEERNGLDHCKNCGTDYKVLEETIEQLLATSPRKSTLCQKPANPGEEKSVKLPSERIWEIYKQEADARFEKLSERRRFLGEKITIMDPQTMSNSIIKYLDEQYLSTHPNEK